MSTEENKTVVRQLFQALNQEDWAEVAFGHFHAQAAGAQDFKALHSAFRAAFPDYHFTIDDLIAEGDQVVVIGTVRATAKEAFPFGDLKGLAPMGQTVVWNEVQVLHFENGKITDGWVLNNARAKIELIAPTPTKTEPTVPPTDNNAANASA